MFRFNASLIRLMLLVLVVSAQFLVLDSRKAAAEGNPKPVNLALLAPIQLVPQDQSVKGFRFSLLYGRNYDMEGLDISLVGLNDNDFSGVQFAAVGITKKKFTGVQWAAISWAGESLEGAQLGFFNGTKDMKWIQVGTINYAESVEGIQLSFINFTDYLHGIQVGILNFAKNGFMPVFPLFNFNFDD